MNKAVTRKSAPRLPDYRPITEIIRDDDIDPHYTGTFRLQKLPDGRLAVDACKHPDGTIYVKAWRREDHPNMKLLPWNVPRAVKALYRAEVQLAFLRATAFWPTLHRLREAEAAWESYWASIADAA